MWRWARAGGRLLRRLAVIVVTIGISASVAQLAFASPWTIGVVAGSKGEAHSTTVTAPTGVTSSCPTPLTSKTVKVTWTAVTHATYSVFQSTTSSTTGFSQVATGIGVGSWTSATLANGTYWYQVALVFSSTWTSSHSASTAARVISSTTPVCA